MASTSEGNCLFESAQAHLWICYRRTVSRHISITPRCWHADHFIWTWFAGKNLLLLSLAWCFGMAFTFIQVSTTTYLVKTEYNSSVAALPVGLQWFCTAFTASLVPSSIKKYGHAKIYQLGAAVAFVGACIEFLAIVAGVSDNMRLTMLCFGAFLMGLQGACLFNYRLAGALFVPKKYAPQTIAWITFGGVLSAALGPELAKETKSSLSDEYAGSFVVAMCLMVATLIVVTLANFDTAAIRARDAAVINAASDIPIARASAGLTLGIQEPAALFTTVSSAVTGILKRRDFILTMLLQTVSYSGMISLMAITPVAMADADLSFADATLAIECHLIGMFAPSAVTGHLINVFSGPVVMVVGNCVLIAGTATFFVSETSAAVYTVAIAMVGVGWNWSFVPASGAAMNLAYATPRIKNIAVAVNETLMLTTVAVFTTSAGFFYAEVGWKSFLWFYIAYFSTGLGISLLWLFRRKATQATLAKPKAVDVELKDGAPLQPSVLVLQTVGRVPDAHRSDRVSLV
eukprot:m.281613 g.281613  ORF g.281613 m.281613 type:complete len:517 (-) comp19842_c0_seq1:166-1716(-)